MRAVLRALAPVAVLLGAVLTLAALFPRSRAKPECGPRFIGLVGEPQRETVRGWVRDHVPRIAAYDPRNPFRSSC